MFNLSKCSHYGYLELIPATCVSFDLQIPRYFFFFFFMPEILVTCNFGRCDSEKGIMVEGIDRKLFKMSFIKTEWDMGDEKRRVVFLG